MVFYIEEFKKTLKYSIATFGLYNTRQVEDSSNKLAALLGFCVFSI